MLSWEVESEPGHPNIIPIFGNFLSHRSSPQTDTRDQEEQEQESLPTKYLVSPCASEGDLCNYYGGLTRAGNVLDLVLDQEKAE